MTEQSRVRSRGWMVTDFHPLRVLDAANWPVLPGEQFAAWQVEKCPTSGRLHIQAYVYFRNPRTFDSVRSFFSTVVVPATVQPTDHVEVSHTTHHAPHIERARCVKRAIEYCQKEETRQEGPWSRGEQPTQGQRTDIEQAVAAGVEQLGTKRPLQLVAREHTNAFVKYHRGIQLAIAQQVNDRYLEGPPEVWVYWGGTGTGKSYTAHRECPDAYVWTPENVSNTGHWWDGYLGHNQVIMEEFRGQIKFSTLLALLDRYPYTVHVKGGMVPFVASKIIFTSPTHPREWYPNLAANEGLISQLFRRIPESNIKHFAIRYNGV